MHLYCYVKMCSEFHVANLNVSNRSNARPGEIFPWERESCTVGETHSDGQQQLNGEFLGAI